MQTFLASSEFIDWQHPLVAAKAAELADHCADRLQVAKRCFEFVRDEICHSCDFQLNPVTCRASEVLMHRTGYCYAKSHLLAALLSANGIPAGLCYQRLAVGEQGPPFCLHGLHVDDVPGDRASTCGGVLVPEGFAIEGRAGVVITYGCAKCGAVRSTLRHLSPAARSA